MLRGVVAAFQHLQYQRRSFLSGQRTVGAYLVGRELTYLINLTAVRIFVCHSQHLVLVQTALQRYISQCAVQRIFRTAEQPRRLQFLIILTRHKVAEVRLHDGCHLLYIAHVTHAENGVVLVVRFVRRNRHIQTCPLRRAACTQTDMLRVVLAQVTQRQDVSRLVVSTAFVRYPHLYSVDRHAARYVGQRLHGGLVVVAEEVTKEEVPVLVVTVDVYLVLRHLCTAFAAHTLALRVLL